MRPFVVTLLLAAALVGPSAAAKPADGNEKAAARAHELVGWMGSRSDSIHVWLREARAQGEDARASCLDTLLDQAHAVERQGIEINEELQHAAASGEDHVMGLQMMRLRTLADRSRAIFWRAGSCGTRDEKKD